MTARIVTSATRHVSVRVLVIVTLAAALLAVVLSHALLAAGGGSGAPSARATETSSSALGRLSPAARASISASLGADEQAYHFARAPGGFQAANPAQHLAVSAGRAGVSVRERHLELGFGLQAIGYGNSLRAVRTLGPSRVANRVTYAGAQASEWYANGPLGLEQGFTVNHAPVLRAAGPLTLAISLSGNAHASLVAGGQSVNFTAAGGGALRYGGLSVTDASGRALHSSLALAGGRLLLRVDARGARYPLRVDPNVEEAEKELRPTEGEETERAGISVALSADGGTALVGAPAGEGGGAVWVFTRNSEGDYEQSEELTSGDAEVSSILASCGEQQAGEEPDECRFGSSLAISPDGETAVVGAPGANNREGAVFMFTNSGSGWEGMEVTSPGATVGGVFGRSVALSANGEIALIGAPGERDGRGQAWVYKRSDTTWTQLGQPLSAGDQEDDAHFGKSVALSGSAEVALIGAPDEGEHDGGVWVFESSVAGGFLLGSRLQAAALGSQARFGSSVALSEDGDTALVSAPDREGPSGEQDAGAVLAFARYGSQWAEQKPALEGPAEENELFGFSVALSPEGDTAVVGAPRGRAGVGEAWLYERSASGWSSPATELIGRDEQGKARFGKSVAASAGGEVELIGAPGNGGREGTAWAFGPGPAIQSVKPASGPPQGGTPVTITGQHFMGATNVFFESAAGKVEAKFEEVSASVIKAISPPGTGTVHITVTTPVGTSEKANPADEFTYEHPEVTSIAPTSGTNAGGTAVKIEGKFLQTATEVRFGSKKAKFEAEGDEAINAISPGGHVGTVDVTVVTSDGVSETTPADRFTYTEPGGRGGKHGETSGGEDGSSGGTGSGGTGQGALQSGAGGVLALGPIGADVCGASLLSKKISVQRHKLAVFKLVGTGLGRCSGKLRLRVRLKLGHHRFMLKTIGTAVFTISAGRRVSVSVKLNRAGRALLRAHHGRLNASLLLVKSSPLPSLARTASVRLAPQPPTRKPKPKG
jgi:hypothetical protein